MGKNILKKIFSPIVFVGMQIVITIVFLYYLFNFAVLSDIYAWNYCSNYHIMSDNIFIIA